MLRLKQSNSILHHDTKRGNQIKMSPLLHVRRDEILLVYYISDAS